jgi:hypothetical protein
MPSKTKNIPPTKREEIVLEEVRKALQGLMFGTVTIIVQDGIVIQIDRTSKQRLDYSTLERVSEGEGI